MPGTLFISDLHLDPARPQVTRALQGFLQHHSDKCEALYVLGDLFEAWIGDDDDAELAQQVAGMFRAFSAAGPALYLMQGNRDFLLGAAFCEAVGGQLQADPSVIDLYGTSTLLMHGDTLCTADTAYLEFRALARSPDWQAQMLAHSLPERRALAAQLREASRESTSNKAEDIMDVTPAEVERVMAQYGSRQLLHGHTHRPAHHTMAAGDRWVLGDWDEQGWFIRATPAGLELVEFDLNQYIK